jgi:hypothetical protein
MHAYQNNWHDMSEYVVHFTKPNRDRTAYDNSISILGNRVLEARTPFGIARNRAPNVRTQNAVCFSEVPLHLIHRVAERRGRYGIGFTKEFILQSGGGPIWYVENESAMARAINQLMAQALRSDSPEEEPIWTLTPFIDVPGDYPDGAYRFEWEREWRFVGDLSFSENDPAFLFIPEELHLRARAFFENAQFEHIGPAYLCPYIDIGWTEEQIAQALQNQ